MLDLQQLENKCADWPANNARNETDEQCTHEGMCVAVKNGLVLNDANEAEMPPADGLEGGARA